MSMEVYDETFFDYANQSSTSAIEIVRIIKDNMKVSSVVDVGCAEGIWLKAWESTGVQNFRGLDGDYVELSRLHIPTERFVVSNLEQPFDLEERFDIAQSFEVAEHLPASSARGFIESLTRHADIVMFSAAPPGQGGRNHINEQPYDYWKAIFNEYGYAAFDCIRPEISSNPAVAWWYRYNAILFVKKSATGRLPDKWKKYELADSDQIPDVAPLTYKIRKLIVRSLPRFMHGFLARMIAAFNR